jgi:site-specific recombinase XerC
VRELELPKAEKKLPLVLTRQQIDELLAAPLKVPKQQAAPTWMPLRDVAIMEVFYSSGLRLGELASLNVADVDLYTESVRVLGKAVRNASARSALPPSKRSPATAQLPTCRAVPCSSIKDAAAFRRDPSGSR